MATTKTLISLDNLKAYNTKVQSQISGVEALANAGFKVAEYDETNHQIKLYTTKPKAEGATPDATITLPADTNSRVAQAESDIDALEALIGSGFSSTATVAAAIAAAQQAADDAQADVDAVSAIVGKEAKAGSGTPGEEGYVAPVAATGLVKKVADLENGLQGNITAEIEKLDAEKSQEAGADGLALSIKEVDGKITEISGSIAANTYDAYGSASAVQGETTETVASVNAKVEGLGTASASDVATVEIGTENEATDALPTVAQVKKYVTDSVADLEGATHFIGKKTELPATANDGDICIVGVKEYIYNTEDGWVELGDETIYATKATTIAGVDLQNDITATEMKAALDIDDLETLVGDESVASRIDAEAKDATYEAAVVADPENGIEGKAKVTIAQAIKANADAIAAIDVSGDIDDKIAELDAEKSQTAGADGLALSITEVDGKITAISGSIAANTYDAYGAAGAVQEALDYTVPTDAEMLTALGLAAE